MKKISRKKIIIFIITIMLSIIYFGITNKSHAAEVVEIWDISANDGKSNVTATLYDDGNFVINGTGKMKDYDCFSNDNRPFYTKIEDIKKVEIKNGVTSIGKDAFYKCSSLTNIDIPSSVTSIGKSAFSRCSSLTEINIPSSVTSIGDSAFIECRRLKKITIPSSVTSIGKNTFSCCSSLTSVEIPDSVTSIGNGAFDNCSSLTQITIPSSVTSIDARTFVSCSKLNSIIVDKNNQNYSSENNILYDKNKTLLIKCGVANTGNLNIPSSVTSIGEGAFEYCSSLTEITIPSSVTSIGKSAFYYCSNLTSINILSSITKLESSVFQECSNLIKITIPSSVTSIGKSAFYRCSSLTSINIPINVTSIGDCAFEKCSSLTKINIPTSVTDIGENSFYGCNNYKNLTIYTSSDYVANYAKENEINYIFSTMNNAEENSTEWTIEDGKTYMEIKENTAIEEIKSNIRTNGTIEVYKGDTKITENNNLLGTGMEIRIKFNDLEEKIIAIVRGDITGDGKTSIGDLSQLSRYAAGIEKNLSIEYLKASDVVKDGKYGTISDILKMSRVLAKMDTL